MDIKTCTKIRGCKINMISKGKIKTTLQLIKYFLFELKLFGCNHLPSCLDVISRDVQLSIDDDDCFEKWECTCKCKCGEIVKYNFSFGTAKFYKDFKHARSLLD